MNKITKRNSLYKYSIPILTISLVWTFSFPISVSIYAPIFNGLFGFIVFMIWSQSNFYTFSELLEIHHPDIFGKNTLWYGPFKNKRLYGMSLFTEYGIYNNLEPKELHESFRVAVLSYTLAIFHFFMSIVFAVGLMYWNYYSG